MHDQPEQPGGEAAPLHTTDLGHSLIAPDGRHRAEVAVGEGTLGAAFEACLEVGGQELSLLQGHLRQLGMPLRIVGVAGHEALVTEGEDVGVAEDLAMGVDEDTAATAEGLSREACHLVGRDTAHPDDGAGAHGLAVGEGERQPVVVGDHLAEVQLHP